MVFTGGPPRLFILTTDSLLRAVSMLSMSSLTSMDCCAPGEAVILLSNRFAAGFILEWVIDMNWRPDIFDFRFWVYCFFSSGDIETQRW